MQKLIIATQDRPLIQSQWFNTFNVNRNILFCAGIGFIYVLLIYGALPGIATPTLGQAIWLGGFAESLATDFPSTRARDFGFPNPVSISFGLSGALITSVFIKMGFNLVDAYSLMCVFWLLFAFVGAFALARRMGLSPYAALGLAILWLIMPIVWRHAGYSTLSLGIALLPLYVNLVLKFCALPTRKILKTTPWLIFVFYVAAFMDGYSFFMLVSFTFGFILYNWLIEKENNGLNYSVVVAVALLSFVSYSLYANASGFPKPRMDFIRGFGADIGFFIQPEAGSHFFLDLLGISKNRSPINQFGDASVYWTSFSLIFIAVALFFLASKHGDTKQKWFFFIIGFVAIYLSLGPTIKFNSFRPEGVSALMTAEYGIFPSGTEILYDKVPGLKSMRASYRWVALALLACWIIIALGLGSKTLSSRARYGVIILLIALHTPNPFSQFANAKSYRTQFTNLNSDLLLEKSLFEKNERVAFLPYGNDFLANYIWKLYDIQIFNVGGDKNLFLAKQGWPQELQNAGFMSFKAQDYDRAAKMLLNKDVDTIALTNISLLRAAHAWPPKLTQNVNRESALKRFSNNPAYEVRPGKYFSTVRVKEQVQSSKTATKQALDDLCIPSICIKKSMDGETVFTQVGTLIDGSVKTSGKSGFLFFGPYSPILKGDYTLVVEGRVTNGEGTLLDVVANFGNLKIAKIDTLKVNKESDIILSTPVTISEDVEKLEIRLYVSEQSDVSIKGYKLVPK